MKAMSLEGYQVRLVKLGTRATMQLLLRAMKNTLFEFHSLGV